RRLQRIGARREPDQPRRDRVRRRDRRDHRVQRADLGSESAGDRRLLDRALRLLMSIFDRHDFNERLFFPRTDTSPTPPGPVELDLRGGHVRRYAATPGLPTLLVFHGNGEVVADYDDQAARFAAAGANLAVMDYRGYGKSHGTPTLRGILADAH